MNNKNIQDIQKFLTTIWLKHKESQVYIITYQYWQLSAWAIAKHTGIARSSVYDIASTLIKKWFLKTTIKRSSHQKNEKSNTKNFVAIDPHDIYTKLHEKKNILENQAETCFSLLPSFEKIRSFTWDIPNIQYHEWKESLTYFFKKIAEADYSYSIFSVDDLIKHIFFDLDELYSHLSHIHVSWAKRIVIDTPLSRKYVSMQKNKNIQRKFLPQWYDLQAEITLYNDTLLQISLWEQPSILQIPHKTFYTAQKTIFDYMRQTITNS